MKTAAYVDYDSVPTAYGLGLGTYRPTAFLIPFYIRFFFLESSLWLQRRACGRQLLAFITISYRSMDRR